MRTLVTGGSGFLGTEVARKLRDRGWEVILGSRNVARNLVAERATGCSSVPLDVSSLESVRDVMRAVRPESVIHAAASKFVDVSERNPMECVDVNVRGSQNVIRVSEEQGVRVLVGVSTDKAASPGNLYGFTKALMERMLCSSSGRTSMLAVRGGNIAWSTGSVLPIWRRRLDDGEKLGATEARRFFLTASEAADLVIRGLDRATDFSGKILMRRMGVVSVSALASEFVSVHGGKWETMRLRPGDKLEECLIGHSEYDRATLIQMDGLDHYVIDHASPPQEPLSGTIDTTNSEMLGLDEIRRIVLSEPGDPERVRRRSSRIPG